MELLILERYFLMTSPIGWYMKQASNIHICLMPIYWKYRPYGSKLVMLYYVDDWIYCYTSEELGKWFVGTLGNILHVNFLGHAHWFMSITISQLKYHSISVYQVRYATSVSENYLDIDTIKEKSKYHDTTLPHDMIFTKEYASNNDEQVEVLFIE